MIISVPILVNGQAYFAILDYRASNILISLKILDNIKANIISKDGIIIFYDSQTTNRIGITSLILLQCGDKEVRCSMEVAKLPEDSPILIGYDLFAILGFGILGLPVDFPGEKKAPTMISAEEPDLIISSEVIEQEQNIEFIERKNYFLKQIILALTKHTESSLTQVGTFCTISKLIIELSLKKKKPIYIRQYPISQMLKPVMDEYIEK